MARKQVDIYTDGACSGNPGPGGWGAVLLYGSAKKELSGAERNTTNNRMEMMAAIQALSALKEPCNVALYTDSSYLLNAFAKHWLDHWQKNNWMTSKKQPVENQDLWQQLLRLTKIHFVQWNKVKGHSTDELNNRCDELARKAIQTVRS